MKLESLFDPDRKISLLVSLFASALIIGIDLLTPPQILLSIFFILPILIAGWYNSLRWALILSVTLPLARFFIATFIEPLWHVSYNLINAIDRFLVFSLVSLITARLSDSVKRLKREIKVLEGLIPICTNCKKIRDQNQEWQPLEKYLTERSDTQFTHGICPDCMKLLYGDYIKKP
jgi:K+-sensing histidine kinase KdpD